MATLWEICGKILTNHGKFMSYCCDLIDIFAKFWNNNCKLNYGKYMTNLQQIMANYGKLWQIYGKIMTK